MKRTLGLLAATALLASGGVAVGTGSVGAQATTTPIVPLVQTVELTGENHGGSTQIYAVHGLNLAGQTAQSDGGTAVTVCAGSDQLIPDFQFGDIVSAGAIPVGTPLSITVLLGADVPCGTAAPIISLDVTVPAVEGGAIALVATAGPDGELELLPVELDLDANPLCGEAATDSVSNNPQGGPPQTATLAAVHAAAAPPVTVEVEGEGTVPLAFGETYSDSIVPDTYGVTVLLGETPIVGPVDLKLDPCTLTVVYVVGNQPIAEEPTTTTTAPAPAAQAVAARPAFTG
jgi:hypothetical protein